MLLNIATFLIAIWGLGLATSHTLGGFIHVVLFFAVVAAFAADVLFALVPDLPTAI